MKTLIGCLFATLMISASTLALAGGGHGRGHWGPPPVEQRVERLTEELGLSPEQAAQVTEIFTASDAEREATRARHEAQIRAEACALMAAVSAQLDEVLTAEQSAELDELMAQRAERFEDHDGWRGKGRHGPPDCEDPSI